MSDRVHFLPEVGFVKEPVVLAHVGMARTKWRSLIKAGEAPAPIPQFSDRLRLYDARSIRKWIDEHAKVVA